MDAVVTAFQNQLSGLSEAALGILGVGLAVYAIVVAIRVGKKIFNSAVR